MNRVIVEFHGICTHVSRQRFPELPVPHRVLLVNASGPTYLNTVHIPRHVASVTWPDGTTYAVAGVSLMLAVEAHLTEPRPLTLHLEDLPNLTELMEEIAPLSPPARHMVFNPSAEDVACYFDISFGTLSAAINDHDAAYTTLTVESEHPLVLNAAPFGGTTLPSPQLAQPLRLTGESLMVVANVDATAVRKTMADFLLHYRFAERMPAVPQIPQLPTLRRLPRRPPRAKFTTIGAGCSNSNYP